jgi:hypothetical protein
MHLIFPSIVAQSIAVAHGHKVPDVLVIFSREVPVGGIIGMDGRPATRTEHSSERCPFEYGLQMLIKQNDHNKTDDTRTGQTFSRIIK